ncbi:MAG: DUF2628 domain-containing protein [Rickettsiaceae bacterium]|nr:DUF2628 domain-containing protein [Rickettsiaceae bacterium]
MKLYAIYSKLSEEDSTPIIIKQGFSFWATVLNFFWALYHRMWIVTFFTLIANILVVYISASKPEIISIAYLINFAILLVFGFFSTEMQEFTAKRQGLKLEDIILAKSEDEAEILYFMRKYKIKATR